VRGNGSPDYTFTYATVNGATHLTGISNSIQTAENYTFTYSSPQPLNSPFTPFTGYGDWTFLSIVANGVPLTTSFTYDTTGTGELDEVTLPYGGHVRWAYGPFTYSGSRVLREVNGGRFLSMYAGASELTYGMSFDPTANATFHSWGVVDDPDGNSERAYYFGLTAGQPGYGLLSQAQSRLHHSISTGMRADTYTWTTDSTGNQYITTDLITEDAGNPTQVQKQTTQTKDQYGNLLQMKVYNYGNLTSPARTYTNTYLPGSNYTSLYIFNRLQTSTVTDGTNTTTLATNVYDNASNSYCSGYSLTGVSANEHDNTNYGTGFAYRGNPAAMVTPAGTQCITNDTTGNVVTNNNNGLTTSVTTSNNYAVPATITTNSLQSTATWQPFLGLSTAVGPNGDTTSVTYDANARPLTSVSKFGATTNYTYNDTAAPHSVVATTNGHWVKTILDGFGRTVSTQTGNGTTVVSEVDTTYIGASCEPLGKMGARSQPYVPGATVYNTTYTYDGLSRTLTKVAADGSSTTTYSYAGNTTTVTDAAGKTKTFTRDAFGNLTQVQEPNPGSGPQATGTPVFSPAPGTYSASQTITITTTTTGASIRYTTNGSTPSETAGTLYSGPVSIPSTATLKAIAYASGIPDSSITSGPYTIGTGGTAWYNTAWSSRKPVTIAHGQVSGSSNLTNFPMLFSVTDSNLAASAQANGNDILFTASDGVTKLNHEIELYTSSTGHLIAWVQIPTLSPTADTTIYVYYGNASAPNQQNATAVWDSNYKGVWHLPNGTTLTAADSTSNGNNGTIGSGVSATSGQIDGAAAFSSSDIDAGANSSLYSPVITVSAWLNASSLTSLSTALSELDDVSNDRDWILGLGSGGTNWRFVILSGTSQYNAVSTATAVANSWHYVVGVYDGTTESIYVDGSLSASTTVNATLNTFTNDHFLMGERTGGDAPWTGAIDEVRYSNAVRPAAWIATEYNNQNSPSAFSSEGSAQSCCGGSGPGQFTAPSFSPAPDTSSSSQSVSITAASNAIIRYTLDGSTPSETNGIVYTGPVNIVANATLQAIAYNTAGGSPADSPVTAGTYWIQLGGTAPYVTTYTYDMLNHLTSVSMPRGSNNQPRTFNYTSGTTVGINLLSATNPENGQVTYTYNSDNTIHTKTDAKNQTFTYAYDSYKRVTQISVGSTTLRTFMYDTNTLDGTFSGSYTAGRLVAVQNAQFNAPGRGAVTALQFTEMYGYTQAGQISGKRLQSNQTLTGGTVKTLNMDATYAYDSEGKMTSVVYPTTYAWNGSALVPTAGPTYTYSFDAMDRATGLKDQNNNVAVSGVTYNPANQFLTVDYFGANETRTYNSMNQMTRLSIPGSLDISYNFISGADNGKIGSQIDNISGETVTYQYDSLKRLISASGSGWSETYGYDAFGNLTSKTPTGTAPTLSQAVSATTNQIVGQTYDANGNQLSGPLGSVTYDPENRILTAPGVQYAYDSTNKRVWKGIVSGGAMTAQEVYFYGVNSQKLATYALTANAGTTPYLANSATTLAVFFRRKRVGITTNGTTTAFVQDRLGSQGKYYPYGEARGTVPQDAVGFASYTQDSATALDYADQRYYANNFGRFMTPDPYGGSRSPRNPTSWNRYSYVLGDPINGNDLSGLDCGTTSNQTGAPSEVDCGNDQGDDSQDSDEGDDSAATTWTSADITGTAWVNQSNGADIVWVPSGDGFLPFWRDENGVLQPATPEAVPDIEATGSAPGATTVTGSPGSVTANGAATFSYSWFSGYYGLGGQANIAYLPGTNKVCAGPALGVGTPGKSYNMGILVAKSPYSIFNIIHGFSVTFALQLTNFWGGQASWSPGNGWASGPTVGTPGASLTAGFSGCTALGSQ
jgi:RHS repeat-associated protein